MHYYQFNIADYRKDTVHLTPIEHFIYRSLLDTYYLTEAPISLDIKSVMRTHCLRTADDEQSLVNVLNDFFEHTENGYLHKRVEQQLAEYKQKSEKAAQSARAGWEKRQKNKPIDANALQTQSECIANDILTNNHKPITNNYKPVLKTVMYDKSDFNEFWKAYPKKVGKEAAIKAWEKAKPRIDDVMHALAWQVKSDQWFKNGGQYIPNPATYINQGRWQDEPTEIIGF